MESGNRGGMHETEEVEEDDTGESEETSGEEDAVEAADDWESLPKMSHQSMRYATAAGFGEIFNTTTQPIYSKMDLTKLVSAVGSRGEMPPLPETPSTTSTSDKHEQFEKIYGKLKKVEKENRDRNGQQATTADPLQDVMQSNFVKTIVKTCLYRLVLLGSHNEDQEKLIEWMKDVVEDINVHSYSETLTGVFLSYPNHFVHVLESSEDTLMKYIRLVADQFEPTGFDWKLEVKGGHVSVRRPIIFTTVRAVVVGIFQIKHRGVTSGWKAERAMGPLTMTQDQVPAGDYRERLFHVTRQCIIMAIALYKLNPLRPPAGVQSTTTTSTKKSGHRSLQASIKPSSAALNPTMQIGAAAGAEAEATRVRYEEQRKRRAASIAQIIPKPAMIDYIMRKNEKRKIQLRTVREHLDFFWKIPKVIFSQQTDWPIASKIAPYN